MELQLKTTDTANKTRLFKLESPVNAGREVLFAPTYKGPNTFHLPRAQSETYSYKDQFTGDVTRGGSCNVDRLSYIPHTLTHIESSAHVLGPQESGVTIKDIPGQNLCGLAYLVDISHLDKKAGSAVLWQDIEEQIKKITLPISILAIKTKSSLYTKVEETILAHHAYELPEVIQLPISAGSASYLGWIDRECC